MNLFSMSHMSFFQMNVNIVPKPFFFSIIHFILVLQTSSVTANFLLGHFIYISIWQYRQLFFFNGLNLSNCQFGFRITFQIGFLLLVLTRFDLLFSIISFAKSNTKIFSDRFVLKYLLK